MKICPKCNAQLADDIKFCNSCGTSVADVAPMSDNTSNNTVSAGNTPFPGPIFNGPQNADQGNMNQGSFNQGNGMPQDQSMPQNNSMPQPGMNPLFSAPPVEEPKKKKSMLPLLLGVAAAAVVLVVVIALVLLLGGGYKKPVNKLVSLVNSKSTNVSSYMECVTPSFVPETYKEALGLLKGGDAKSELDDTINDAFDEAFDGIEDQFGKNWKVTVEWKKNKKLSDKDIKNLQKNYDSLAKTIKALKIDDEDTWEDIADAIDDEYDTEINTEKAAKMGEKLMDKLDKFEITEGYEVKVKVNIEGKDDKESATMEANIIKANGKWFIDPLSFSEGGISASSLLNSLGNLDF